MSNDPETGSDETSGKTVKGPEGKAGKGIKGRRGKGNVFRGEERFYICGGFINGTDEEEVPNAVCGASDAVMCTTHKELGGKLTHRARSGVPNA
jgi:hypothetical protein